MVIFFSMLSLVASLVSLFMGGVVLLRNPRASLNRVFCLLCLSISYWAFIEFRLRLASDFAAADSLIQMLFIWPWTSAFALHFALIFTGQKKILASKLVYLLVYGPALLISVSYLMLHSVHGEPVNEYWGWTYQSFGLLFVRFSNLYVGLMAIAAVYLCLKYYRKLAAGMRKTQAKYITIGLAIPTITGIITEVILPQAGMKVPEMTTIGFAAGCGGFISYAILRYELFELTPTATAEEIVSMMSGGLFLVSPDGALQMANRAALELLDYPEEELVGRPLEKIFSQQWVEENLQTTSAKKHTQAEHLETEVDLMNSSGGVISASVSVTRLSDTRGNYAGSIIIARDVTEQKQAEKSLRESEAKLKTIMESVQAGIVIIDRDTHVIVDLNNLAASMIGEPKEEIKDSVCHRFICPAEKGKCPVADLHQNVNQSERVLLTATGETRPILKSVTTVRLDGKEYLLESFIDISDRKKAEAETHWKSALLEAQLDSTIDGILIVDEDGKKVVQNRRCLELWKMPQEIAASGDFQKQIDFVMGAVKDSGKFIEKIVHLYDHPDECSHDEVDFSDGTVLDRHSSPVIGSGGKHFGRIWIFRDITEQKQNEAKLLKQSEELMAGNQDLLAFNEISSLISREIDLRPMLSKFLTKITELDIFSFERKGGVLLLEDGHLELVSSLGHSDEFLESHRDLKLGQCLCGRAAVSGDVLVEEDCEIDHRHEIRYPGMKPHGHVIVPLKAADRPVGVLYLYTPVEARIQERHIRLLESIGSLLGVAIANARLFEETKRLSLHDPLTGFANRNLMTLALTRSFAIARRTGRPISLVMLDLDYFKNYNDTYGHASGDRLLQDVSQLISREIREVDLGVRYGGEEFLLILTDTDLEQAIDVAERLRKSVEAKEFYSEKSEQPTHITVSLGVAAYDGTINNKDILVARADTSLYRAKGNGRNRVEAWLQNVRQ